MDKDLKNAPLYVLGEKVAQVKVKLSKNNYEIKLNRIIRESIENGELQIERNAFDDNGDVKPKFLQRLFLSCKKILKLIFSNFGNTNERALRSLPNLLCAVQCQKKKLVPPQAVPTFYIFNFSF